MAEGLKTAAGAIGGTAHLSIAPPMSLKQFIVDAWHVPEPEIEFNDNWHIDAIAQHLEAVADGRITRLIINIPPGHMKSLITAVFWPAWMWTFRPGWRALFGSYALELAIRDAQRTRDLLISDWYQDTFKPTWRMSGDQNVKSYYQNTRRGSRLAIAVGARTTGFRGHCTVIDDPLNVEDAFAELKRKKAIRYIDKSLSSRLNDQRTGARVFIGQRVHEEDPFGHLISRGGYEVLRLPSEYESKNPSSTSIGWKDPRTQDGELLFPTMFPREVLREAKEKDLGTDGYAGQHQQRPAPAGGAIFKDKWFRLFTPRTIPGAFSELYGTWDMAFKATKGSSFVSGQVWGISGANIYFLGRFRKKVEFPDTVRAVIALSKPLEPGELDPDGMQRVPGVVWKVGAKLVEDKANGPAVIQTLRNEIPGLIAVPGNDDKVASAHAVSWYVEGGNVYLPDPTAYPQLRTMTEEFLQEITRYPNSTYTDETVSFVQGVRIRAIPAADRAAARAKVTPITGTPTRAGQLIRQERW